MPTTGFYASYKIARNQKPALRGISMNRLSLLSALMAVAVALPFDAEARGRSHSSHSHSSSGSHPHTNDSHASDSHTGESNIGGAVRSSISRHRSDNNPSGNGSENVASTGATSAEDDANLRRIRQEREAARAKAEAENMAARNAQIASDEEKRRQLLEQAATRAAEEQKRKDAANAVKNRELAMLERQQRQAAWEARCQIKPVMSDAEIATCKEVWSSPAR
jgi:hypothetical protein